MVDVAVDSGMLRSISQDISRLASVVYELDSSVTAVRTDVGKVSQDVTSINSELLELKRAFDAYVAQAERIAAVQRAETRRGNLEAELERQYGHYGIVRRTSVGVLQAFDVANVSDDVVAHVSEELMIQSPRYWLAPALVGIAAWSRDDEEITQRSIAEAFKRDASKTSLFFALVLRRCGRVDAATRWLRHYLNSCTSSSLTRDFAVILESAAQGAFGPDGAQLLADQIKKWNSELRMNQNIADAQVAEWQGELANNAGILSRDEYPELREVCPDFPKLEAMLNAATALGNTANKYQAVLDDDYTSPGYIADLLDDLLEQLVTEYDEEELPLRREVAYNQAIVETDGDMDRAEETASQYQRALEETVDAVSLQTRTAISPELMGVSVSTQKVSIGSGQKDFLEGLNAYTRQYRSQAISQAHIVLDTKHSGAASTYSFVGHKSSTAEPEDVVVNRLRGEWEQTFAAYIESMRFKQESLYLPAAIVVVSTLIGFAIHPLLALLIAVAGGGFVYYRASEQKKKSEAAIAQAESARDKSFEVSRDILIAARAAFIDMQLEYEELEQDEAALRHLVETWPTAVSTVDPSDV